MVILHEVYCVHTACMCITLLSLLIFRQTTAPAYSYRFVTIYVSKPMCCPGYTGYSTCKRMYIHSCMYVQYLHVRFHISYIFKYSCIANYIGIGSKV